MFSRTAFGLSAEHLFHNVDLMVYCEGIEGEGEASTLDEAFWRQVLSRNGKRVKCKSLGPKNTLFGMAELVTTEDIKNVAVAMDRDYDHLRGNTIHHHRVLYTLGYSWESDVMLRFDFDVAIGLFADVGDQDSLRHEFDDFWMAQSKLLKRVFALDLKYIGHQNILFDRSKPVSIVGIGRGQAPYIKVRKLLQRARELGKYQTVSLSRRAYLDACGVRDFFGKTISHLFYQWFIFRTSRIARSRKIPYSAFMSTLISTLPLSDLAHERNSHYARLAANL